MNLGSILPVGTIIHSMLTTTQFASEYGDNWVLADGRAVTGTKYASVTGSSLIPDLRGMFLRGKNNSRTDAKQNPDGELNLGDYVADKLGSHYHNVYTNTGASGGGFISASSAFTDVNSAAAPTPTTYQPMTNTGSNETAPRSVTVNIFIRIN